MKQITDYHIHTIYCDGKDTPKEMLKTALERGFDILGFSGHIYTDFSTDYCMTPENTDLYFDEINHLKKEYKDKITVLCGIEKDYFSSEPTERFDYVIGSVHYIFKNDRYLSVDYSPENFLSEMNANYGGDFTAMAKDYYKLVGDVVEKTNADIIGHFDLITKFIDKLNINITDEYLNVAFNAVHKLIPYKKPFEVNVGAISRGYRTTPYPSEDVLREIYRCAGEIIFTGDCHDRENLGCYYDDAVSVAKKCGFTHHLILTENGFEKLPIE